MMKNTKRYNVLHTFLWFFISFIFSETAWAGGLYINEFGIPSMGVASAGAQAVASDASTSFHNPAGMTRLNGLEILGVTNS
jgi:long-chain fatty acid transport protein